MVEAEEAGVLARELGVLLRARGQWVAVAESLTAGHLQAMISGVSGASAYFAGGMTTYTLEQKVALLGVSRDHAASVNCVSAQVAREMALGVAARFGVAVSAATTGYAQGWGDQEAQGPVAFCAVQWGGVVQVTRHAPPRQGRVAVQQEVARYTLQQLVRLLRAPGG